LNKDFCDLLRALSAERVEFLIVGAYALAAHGLPRATGDLDIWLRSTPENAHRVWRALLRFGAPLGSITEGDFSCPDIVYRMGMPPVQIDLLTSISGVEFDAAWSKRVTREIDGITFAIISHRDQIQNKRATGRPQDILDAEWLEKHGPASE
jgi:hypothetical protein